MDVQKIIALAADGVGCERDMVAAVAMVESSLGQHLRRFEPHLFTRETGARVSRFAEAERINGEAAARSCSIGMFQVLGKYHQHLNYKTAQKMMRTLMSMGHGAAQAQSFIDYCTKVSPGAGSALRAGDIERFAVLYNGPKALERGYDVKLRTALSEMGSKAAQVLKLGSTGEAVWRLQTILLNEHGATAVTPDGWFGVNTEEAVREFQREKGLIVDGIVGRKTWGALEALDNAGEPNRSPVEQIRDFIRTRPGRSLTIFTMLSSAAGNLGLTGLARFFQSLAVGDYGAAGTQALAWGPWLLAMAGAVVAIWIIVTAVQTYRRQRRLKAVLADAPSFQPEKSNAALYRTEQLGSDHQPAGREPADHQAEWSGGPRLGGADDHAAERESVIDRRGGDDRGRIQPVHRLGLDQRRDLARQLFGR